MKPTNIFLIVIILFCQFAGGERAYSQTGFQRIYGNPSYGHPRMLRITSDGGYVMAGTMYNFTSNDVYVLKTDANGNVQFSKTYGGTASGQEEYAYDIKQTPDGGYIVVGRTRLLDPNDDVYLLKLDANGVLQWSKTFGCVNSDWGDAVLLTNDGGYIICGQTFCSTSLGNAYLIKTDSVGNMLWTKTYGGSLSDEEFYEIEQTADGGYIMTGWTTSFGAGGYDVFLVKTDTSGTVQWSKTFGGAGNDFGTRVRQTADGGYVISGYTDSLGTSGSNDMYLVRTDAGGNLIWSKTIGNSFNELAFDLQIVSSGYVLSGYSYLTSTDRDAALIKTDTSGAVQWAMLYGDALDDNALSVKQLSGGGYIIGAYSTSFAWNPHIYLIKTNSTGISGCNDSAISLTVTTPATVVSSPSYTVNTMSFTGNPPTVTSNLSLWDTSLCSGCIISASITSTSTTNCGDSTGSAAAAAAGGTSPFTYLWSNGQSTQTATGLKIGSYMVTVTDSSGCTATATATIAINISFTTPKYLWAKDIGTTNADYGYDMTTDNSGNVYVTGRFQGTADFDPGAGMANLTSVGTADMYFAKYNANGNYIWAKNVGAVGGPGSNPEVNSIAVDGSGNVYLEGYFINTVDFDPGAGTANLTSSAAGANYSVFFAKYDVSGNYLWAKAVNPPAGNGSVFGNSMTIDAAGNMYISGYFGIGTADFDPGAGIANLTTGGSRDVYIAKYDANGNYVWAKGIGGSSGSDAIYAGYGHRSIALDAAGNIYITGYFYGTVDFDPGAGVATRTASTTFADIYFGKYDNNGNYVWATSVFASDNNDYGYGIAVDGTGNVYITGYFSSAPADFDPSLGVANLTPSGAEDIFLAKYDLNGNYLWAKRMGGSGVDKSFSIALDDSSNAYISGYFNGTVDFDPNAGTANLASAGLEDIFFAKYNSLGNYVWAARVGGTVNDYGQSIVVDKSPNVNVYITGYFSSAPADFDPDTSTVNLSTVGSWDVYFAKYCQTNSCSPNVLTVTDSTTNDGCPANSGTATANVSGGVTPYTYLWSNGKTTQTTTGLVAGTYTVTVTDNACSTGSDTAIVIANSLPVVSLGNDTTFCTGSNLILNAGNSGSTYLWKDSTTAQTDTASSTGQYFVVVTDTNGCTASDTINITVITNFNATITSSLNYCVNGSPVTLTAVNGGGTWAGNGITNTSTGAFNPAVAGLGNHQIIYTIPGSCGDADTATLVVNSTPVVSLGNDTSFCAGISLVLNAGNAGSTYLWQNGSTVQTFTVDSIGQYFVVVTNTNGCTGSDTINVALSSTSVIFNNTDTGKTGTMQNWTVPAGVTSITIEAFGAQGGGGATKPGGLGARMKGTFTVTPGQVLKILVGQKGSTGTLDPAWGGGGGGGTFVTDTSNNPLLVAGGGGGCSGWVGGLSGLTTNSGTGGGSIAGNCGPTAGGGGGLIGNGGTSGGAGGGLSFTNGGTGGAADITNYGGQYSGPGGYGGGGGGSDGCGGNTTGGGGGGYSGGDGGGSGNSGKGGGSYNGGSNQSNSSGVKSGHGQVVITIPGCVNLSVSVLSASICSGNCTTISATPSGGTSPYIYSWVSGGQTTQAISVCPVSTTTYKISITDSVGNTATDSAIVTVNSAPVVALGNDTSFCSGNNLILNAGNAGSTYLWKDSSTAQTDTAKSTGQYFVVVTTNGCSATDTINITINSAPVVSLGNDTGLCTGNNLLLNAGNAGSTYLWKNGSTAQTYTVDSAGQYFVVVTDTNNCFASDTITITVNNPPVVSLGNDTTFCSGNNLVLNAGNVGSTYLWKDSSTAQTDTAKSTGQYFVVVTTNGCSASDTIAITVNSAPVVALGNDTNFCSGNNLILNAGNVGSTYFWNDSTTAQTDTAKSTGQYFVAVTTNGCSASDTINVTVNSVPVVSLGNDTTVCTGNSLLLNAGNVGSTYLWQNSSTVQTLTANSTGQYFVVVTNNGCSSSDTISISVVSNFNASITSSLNYCVNGSAVILTAVNGGGTWAGNGITNTGTGAFSPAVADTGNHQIIYTISGNCGDADTVTIAVKSAPVVSLGNDTGLCTGNNVVLNAGNAGSTYLWQDSSKAQTLTASSAGQYSVVVTNTNSCSAGDTIQILVNTNPVANAGNDVTIFGGESATLNGTGGGTYQWSPSAGLSCSNCANPLANPAQTTIYTLTVKNNNGCVGTDTVTVTIDLREVKYVPNMFSPNDDGKNDKFYFYGKGIKWFSLVIYDRWGEQIIELTDLSSGWDGTFRGEALNSAVFVYFLKGEFNSGNIFEEKGNISLLR